MDVPQDLTKSPAAVLKGTILSLSDTSYAGTFMTTYGQVDHFHLTALLVFQHLPKTFIQICAEHIQSIGCGARRGNSGEPPVIRV